MDSRLPSDQPWLIRVHRGNMRMTFPLTTYQLETVEASAFAHLVVNQMLQWQTQQIIQQKGYPNTPIDPEGKIPMALRLLDRDHALIPTAALGPQLEGQWVQATLDPREERRVFEGSVPLVELELVDTLRIVN